MSTEINHNVTLRRRKQLFRSKSIDSLSNDSSLDKTNSDIDTRSLDLSMGISKNELEEMKVEMSQLKEQFELTQNELDTVICENNELKETVLRQQAYINTLKDLCTSPIKSQRQKLLSVRKKKRHSITDNLRVVSSGREYSSNQNEKDCIENTDILIQSDNYNNNNTLQTNNDINSCSKEIKIATHSKETQTSEMTYDDYNILTRNQNLTLSSHLSNVAPKKPVGVSRSLHKNKIALMSSSCTKGMLPLIEKVFFEFDYCHYLISNATAEKLLHTVKDSLKDFTMQDYCFIFIGENDIKQNDYLDIIENLNKSLKDCMHTNIVVCAPTYIRGALIHNYKVELFNNLLSLDIKNHKYAYFFDSNRTLTFDMFSYRTGKLTKYGWRHIFDQIKCNILIDYNLYYSEVSDNNHSGIDNTLNITVSGNSNNNLEFFL